jgi:putative oxygen-independent coproporphyrinogen III oxidase
MIPASIPLSLYVHLPWCTRKCPYCDFNSHEGFSSDLQKPYTEALLADLSSQQDWMSARAIQSIFIGGGTPSLFEGEWIARLLEGIGQRLTIAGDAEITLESNPGSAEAKRFVDYKAGGITRLSIGVQTFHDPLLQSLGRIHSGDDARRALDMVTHAGFDRWNIDLMHGLPGQTADMAKADLADAIALSAGHISWYQLTIERNTRFWSTPPSLPDEETLEMIQEAGEATLSHAGFNQYEVSAYCVGGEESLHNLNYWQFGDYIGIGAGAHGKVTLPSGLIQRTQRTRSPSDYLSQAQAEGFAPPPQAAITAEALPAEFAMNALRLKSGVPLSDFSERTGLPVDALMTAAAEATAKGWLSDPSTGRFATSALGYRFLDSVVGTFV